jgi:hypothetical protein
MHNPIPWRSFPRLQAFKCGKDAHDMRKRPLRGSLRVCQRHEDERTWRGTYVTCQDEAWKVRRDYATGLVDRHLPISSVSVVLVEHAGCWICSRQVPNSFRIRPFRLSPILGLGFMCLAGNGSFTFLDGAWLVYYRENTLLHLMLLRRSQILQGGWDIVAPNYARYGRPRSSTNQLL